jgi:hypothetical protein
VASRRDARRVGIRKQEQMIDSVRYLDPGKALVSKRCPDRNSEKKHRRRGCFDAFRQTQNCSSWGEPHRTGKRATEREPWVFHVLGEPRRLNVNEYPLNRDQACSLRYRGNDRRSEADVTPPALRRSRMEA